MKRLIRLFTASAVVATVGFLAPAPAHAGTDVCAGLGVAVIGSTGLSTPPNWRTVTFSFSLNGAVCVPSGSTTVTANGTVSGACGSSSGAGVATVSHPHAFPQDHKFAFVSEGTVLTVTGEVVGTVSAVEDPNDTPSCLQGNAVRFLINGSVSFNHNGCTRTTNTNSKYPIHTCT